MKTFFLLMICVTSVITGIQAQSFDVVEDYKKVPTPPSPNASSLGKFGDVPVSPNTGVPDISIPIHTYTDGSKHLNLSVQLKYHAGGHKVEDMASNVGLGWALSAGGVIMRTMRGLPDESSAGYIRTPALPLYNTTEFDSRITAPSSGLSANEGICQGNSPADYIIIKQIAENVYDGECDLFNISVGNINEKFFFNKNGEIVFITPNNLDIVPTYNSANNVIEKFTLTDSWGVTYTFDVKEYTQTDNGIQPMLPAPPLYASSWYLSKIQSADKKEEIEFQYESNNTPLSYEAGFSHNFTSPYETVGNGLISLPVQETRSFNRIMLYDAQRIKKIVLPNKTNIDFEYDSEDRDDYKGDKALIAIKLSNNGFEKKYRLSYGDFVSSLCWPGGINCLNPMPSDNDILKRLKLLSIQELSIQGESVITSIPPYVFQYNDLNLPVRYSKDQDWWGYYNGGAVGDLIAANLTYPPPNGFMFGLDRIPSLDHAKAALLESIQYPTGGKTTFTYELNQALVNGTLKNVGGVRVQMKEDYDPIKQLTYQTRYSYTKPDGTSSGNLLTIPAYTVYWNTMIKLDWNGDVAALVKVFHLNESINPTQTLSYNNGRSVSYAFVREEQFFETQSNGYKIYEFTEGTQTQEHDAIYPFIQKQDFSWEAGLPVKQSIYTSSNFLTSTEENVYQIISQTPLMGDGSTRNLIVGNYLWNIDGTPTDYIYGARYYNLSQGRSQLSKVTRKQYEPSGAIAETITEYAYDNTYYLPTLIKRTDSEGALLETRNYYPFNYNATSYPLMNDLVIKNRVSELISTEEWVTKNSITALKAMSIRDYSIVNLDLLKLNKIYSIKSDNLIPQSEIGEFSDTIMYRSGLIDVDVDVDMYDAKGRMVEYRYRKNTINSLIWGDGGDFPIATVVNAGYNDIAFASFETESKGNWVYESAPIVDTTAPTGRKAYAASNGISREVNQNTTYVVSFWRKGNVSVSNATLSRTGTTNDGWTYEEYILTNATSISISGSGYIDELSLYPQNAQMTSYTYHPLSGITSQTDSNGQITRYEYDVLGRLVLMKDNQGNVIKRFSYSY